MKKAANVFWFGDLNFRVLPIQQLVGIGKQLENRLFRKTLDYESIIGNDELNLERSKGLLFEDFKEGVIKVPSYTDRVLYWSNNPSGLIPLRYDCIWEITTSDHKPVYCLFGMKAIERTQLLPESTFNLPGALIDLSDTLVEPANTHQNGKIL
uniref:Inositol polyphosphate-related phosphatase domain-containing protein n=1 Tax=Ditylenchus dipsaci TaxID=166011 RepID=A0A915DP68_9BILA